MSNWYESSIKSLIEEYFKEHGFSVVFDSSEFWNVFIEKYHKQLQSSQIAHFDKIATEARSYAFNKKYGTYSYLTDYRSVCENWNHIILNEIQKILGKNLDSKKVLALGANNGSELAIIFENFFNTIDFNVVEISETACSSGKTLYPNINFICASMDEVPLSENEFDIFISLRAAYCAGNNLDFIVNKAIHSVKPGGVIIFSISNGYIDVSDGKYTPIKGVYNPENKHCDETETERNINWMKNAMLTNGCSKVDLVDAESEILLISKR